MSITREQVEFFRDNGYVILPGVLGADQIADGRRILDDYLSQSRHLNRSNDVLDLEAGHSYDEPKLRRIKNACTVHPFFGGLMTSQPILDTVEAVLGGDIRYRRSQINLKTAGGGTPVEWHQDFAMEPHTNSDIATVGIAFDDSTVENGCLQVIPGTNRGHVLNHFRGETFVGAISPDHGEVDLTASVSVEVPAGGIWLHHGLVLHGSGLNRSSNSTRRALLIDYAAADAWPIFKPPSDLAEYDARVVRGSANPVIRLAPMAFRIPPVSVSAKTTYDVQALLDKDAAVFASA